MKENEHKHIEDFILGLGGVVHLFLGKTCIYTCKRKWVCRCDCGGGV